MSLRIPIPRTPFHSKFVLARWPPSSHALYHTNYVLYALCVKLSNFWVHIKL